MNIALWVLQGLLAAVFFGSGLMKVLKPRQKLAEQKQMAWANDFTDGQVKLIGLAEVLGAFGLVLPMALHILPILTPLAAVGLGAIMIGATAVHVKRKEPPMPAALFVILTLLIAGGRGLL